MKHNRKIIKMNPCYIAGSFDFRLIDVKNNPVHNPESKNDFTNDHANSRTALMRAVQN